MESDGVRPPYRTAAVTGVPSASSGHCSAIPGTVATLWEPAVHCAGVPDAAVRPGAAGLLIGIECSRVRDNSWMCFTSLVTTQIGIELAAVQRKLPNCVVVGLQLYLARTFHLTLFPRI